MEASFISGSCASQAYPYILGYPPSEPSSPHRRHVFRVRIPRASPPSMCLLDAATRFRASPPTQPTRLPTPHRKPQHDHDISVLVPIEKARKKPPYTFASSTRAAFLLYTCDTFLLLHMLVSMHCGNDPFLFLLLLFFPLFQCNLVRAGFSKCTAGV